MISFRLTPSLADNILSVIGRPPLTTDERARIVGSHASDGGSLSIEDEGDARDDARPSQMSAEDVMRYRMKYGTEPTPSGPQPLYGRELMKFRERHGGLTPSQVAARDAEDNSGHAQPPPGLSGPALLGWRMRHGYAGRTHIRGAR